MTPAEAVAGLLGADVVGTSPLASGLTLAHLADGTAVVAKRAAGPRAHEAEAAGLRWLGESGDVPVPEVLGRDAEWLVLEYVAQGRPGAGAAEAFGRGLAALHLRGAPAFGAAPPDGPTEAWIGLAAMRNAREPDWPTFYAEHRVLPYLRAARDAGALDRGQLAVVDDVCARIRDLAGPPEPPARLHGDTWSGNVHWGADGRVWLLDPAAHGGHRETDLAMLRLFGCPLLDRVLGAYADAAADLGAPLAEGTRDRVALHQLFPLLVHTVLFGGGYAGQAVAAATAAVRGGQN